MNQYETLLTQAISSEIREWRLAHKLSAKSLAQICGETSAGAVQAEIHLPLSYLARIASAMGMTIDKLLRKARGRFGGSREASYLDEGRRRVVAAKEAAQVGAGKGALKLLWQCAVFGGASFTCAGIGQVLRKKREALGLSQNELARRAGVHASYISNMERSAARMRVFTFSNLAIALNMHPSELEGLVEKKEQNGRHLNDKQRLWHQPTDTVAPVERKARTTKQLDPPKMRLLMHQPVDMTESKKTTTNDRPKKRLPKRQTIDVMTDPKMTNQLSRPKPPLQKAKVIRADRSIAVTSPWATGWWDRERNGNLSPIDVRRCSGKIVHWKCPAGPDHFFCKAVSAVVAHKRKGSPCPCCQGRLVSITNSLATLYPELALEFDPELNGEMASEVVARPAPKQPMKWTCTICQSSWSEKLIRRLKGLTCPSCAGKPAMPVAHH